ncbi:MAG TPA: hypothetical protein VK456_05300 [Xanthobacteraceae bacterium]|nr:hypothetical protein [Xanthobacteraceae bacterium]
MFHGSSAAVCAAAIAVVLLVPAPSNARGGAAMAGRAGGFHPSVRPMPRVHPPIVPEHRVPFARREFREQHALHANERRHHRAIYAWPGYFDYGLPVTYGDDGAFYGGYYDPSDLARVVVIPVPAAPPAPVAPVAQRREAPVDRGGCRSQTVAMPTSGGADRSVTITRC